MELTMITHLVATPTGQITREKACDAALRIDPKAQYMRTEVRGRVYVFTSGWGTPEFTIEAATQVWIDGNQRS